MARYIITNRPHDNSDKGSAIGPYYRKFDARADAEVHVKHYLASGAEVKCLKTGERWEITSPVHRLLTVERA
jgi:hypothetical protein